MVAGGGFYSYYNLQYIKLDKEEKNQERKKNSFTHTKKHLTQFLEMGSISFWVQFRAYRYNKTSLYPVLF